MKTYLVRVKHAKGMTDVATMAENKLQAYNKVKAAKPGQHVYKSNVALAACHLDYCTCEKL